MSESTMLEICTRLLADAQGDRRTAEEEFDTGRSSYGFFAMIDLKGSYAFRLSAGERAAYVRSETFVRLLRRLLSAYADVSVMKELGDALLINSSDLKPILESLSVLNTISDLWNYGGAGDNSHPLLSYRAAITFGRATRIARSGGNDLLGSVIDRLSRLSSLRVPSEGALAILDQEAWSRIEDFEFGGSSYSRTSLSTASSGKVGEAALRYSHISIDQQSFRQARSSYLSIRRLLD